MSESAELVTVATAPGPTAVPPVLTPLTGNGVDDTTATVSPASPIDFGTQALGTSSLEKQITLTNTGTLPIDNFGPGAVILGANPNDFVIVADGCAGFLGPIPPGGTCTVDVVFAPGTGGTPDDTLGPVSATLGFLNNVGPPINVILTGNATPAPAVGWSAVPNPVPFGAVAVGTTSPIITIVVTNNSATQFISTIADAKTGTNAADFTVVSDGCVTLGTLPPGHTCDIAVTFKPSIMGAESALLTLTGTGAAALLIPLGGVGTASGSVTVNDLHFGSVTVGSTSPPQTVTITNNSSTNSLIINAQTLTPTGTNPGDFHLLSNTCSNTLTTTVIPPLASCNLIFDFVPTAAQFELAVYTITDNGPGGATVFTLDGTGTASAAGGPVVISGPLTATCTVAPCNLDFGDVGIFKTSAPQVVTITNHSTSEITIGTGPNGAHHSGVDPNDFGNGSGFPTTDNCTGVTIDPGNSCTMSETFTPSMIGLESAELDISYKVGTSTTENPLSVEMTGIGVPQTTDTVSPTSLAFGLEPFGSTSAEQYVTITNTGPLNALHFEFDAIFGTNPDSFHIVTDSCTTGFGVAPGQSCQIGVDFKPVPNSNVDDSRSATLVIRDNTNGDSQTVALTGTGTGVVGTYTVTPGTINFLTQAVGTTSAAQTVTVTNTSVGAASHFLLLFPGGACPGAGCDYSLTGTNAAEFTVVNDLCSGATVDPPGLSTTPTCTLNVEFNPTQTGPAQAFLTMLPKNGSGVATEVVLTGFGVFPGSESLGAAANGLEFGDVIVNTSQDVSPGFTDPQTVVVTNTSQTASLVVTDVSIIGTNAADFTIVPVAGDCAVPSFTLVVGQSCSIVVLFTPSALGDRTGILNIVDNTPQGVNQVSLDGTGVPFKPEQGYWLVGDDGGVFAFGAAHYYGSLGNLKLNKPIVGMAATPDGKGYWLVASDGGIFTFGDAQYYGSTGGLVLNRPIVGMASTPDGGGYWLVASDGGMFSFGDAIFYGSVPGVLQPGQVLNKPIVAMTKTPDGLGYLLVASDGGIFCFGDAVFHGSAANYHLVKPINGVVVTPAVPTDPSAGVDSGYLLSAADGGLFAFGNAQFMGSATSLNLKENIVGIMSSPDFGGYWQVANDGGVFAFGDAQFHGSVGDFVAVVPNIKGMAADPVTGFE
jgi:hypothetical protein